jgi:hypothetical protein
MSGWENIPEETPAPTPTASPALASDVGEAAPAPDPDLITEGDLLRTAEWYFPVLWLAMLLVVCFIGVYSAVGKLPNSPW